MPPHRALCGYICAHLPARRPTAARSADPTPPTPLSTTNPLNHRDDFSRPALRHGTLQSLFQVALYPPSYQAGANIHLRTPSAASSNGSALRGGLLNTSHTTHHNTPDGSDFGDGSRSQSVHPLSLSLSLCRSLALSLSLYVFLSRARSLSLSRALFLSPYPSLDPRT